MAPGLPSEAVVGCALRAGGRLLGAGHCSRGGARSLALRQCEAAVARELPAASQLRLYEFEACPFCRRVREVVLYLDLEITIVPCGQGSRHRETVAAAAAESRAHQGHDGNEDETESR